MSDLELCLSDAGYDIHFISTDEFYRLADMIPASLAQFGAHGQLVSGSTDSAVEYLQMCEERRTRNQVAAAEVSQ